jgi:hypothetical protein
MTTLRMFECGPHHKGMAVARDLIVAAAAGGRRIYVHYPTPTFAALFRTFLARDTVIANTHYAAGQAVQKDGRLLKAKVAHLSDAFAPEKWEPVAGDATLDSLVTVGPRLAEPADVLVLIGNPEMPPRPTIYDDIVWVYAPDPSNDAWDVDREPPNSARRMWASARNPGWAMSADQPEMKTAFFSSCELRSINFAVDGMDTVAAAGPWRRLA